MSYRPGTCEGIVSEVLGLAWDDDYKETKKACEKVIEKRPELEDFCDKAVDMHHEASKYIEGMKSWRMVRNYNVIPYFDDHFDRQDIYQDVQVELERINDDQTTS